MPDPDLEIIWGGQSSRPLDKGGGCSPPKFFSALRASVWSKNKRGPLPWIRHCFGDILRCAEVVINIYIYLTL